MKINNKTRRQIRIQGYSSTLLFIAIIGLIGWLSQRYNLETDWTATGRNTLSEASIKLLERTEGEINITAFARNNSALGLRTAITELVDKYRQHKKDIQLKFINPDTAPDKTRAMGISLDGEMVVEYAGRKEHVQTPREDTLTNTLQRLVRSGERRILFLAGHGERKPGGQANHDLGIFSRSLEDKGISTASITLAETPRLPDNTAALVIADPRTQLLPGEVQIISDYLDKGGNLLWLHEPSTSLFGLEAVAKKLAIRFEPGMVVDPTTQLLGINDPSFTIISRYSQHPITRDASMMTIFPQAVAINYSEVGQEWQAEPLLTTVPGSWSETGKLEGSVEFTKGMDISGPLTIGLGLSRKVSNGDKKDPAQERTQRIVIIGDGDFLSNTYLGNQGNQNLGHSIMNWLSHDDSFIDIPSKTAPDSQLTLTEMSGALIGLFFLALLPLLLLASGITVWLKRRKQ